MVQEFTTYICAYCNEEYPTWNAADQCELKHKELDKA